MKAEFFVENVHLSGKYSTLKHVIIRVGSESSKGIEKRMRHKSGVQKMLSKTIASSDIKWKVQTKKKKNL